MSCFYNPVCNQLHVVLFFYRTQHFRIFVNEYNLNDSSGSVVNIKTIKKVTVKLYKLFNSHEHKMLKVVSFYSPLSSVFVRLTPRAVHLTNLNQTLRTC